jgi:plastocyanin
VAHVSVTHLRLLIRPTRAALALVLAGSLVLAACGEGDERQVASNSKADRQVPGAAGTAAAPPRSTGKTTTTVADAKATVAVKDDLFEPAEVEIAKGEAVAWKWQGKNPHNVSGSGFKSRIQTSGAFTRAFTKAGTFEYRCEVHPTMKGTVVVTG